MKLQDMKMTDQICRAYLKMQDMKLQDMKLQDKIVLHYSTMKCAVVCCCCFLRHKHYNALFVR